MTDARTEWLVATGNRHKLGELRELLAPHGVHVVGPDEVGGWPEVEETGETFRENALLKARAAAAAAGRPALADDSGLEVEALGGAPGVRSARFAGPGADDAANRTELLARLEGVPAGERGARFVCCLVLVAPDGRVLAEVEGTCRGRILESERGAGGFGYDPLFLFDESGAPESGLSFAELEPEAKNRVSHRARALGALLAELPELLGDGPHGQAP